MARWRGSHRSFSYGLGVILLVLLLMNEGRGQMRSLPSLVPTPVLFPAKSQDPLRSQLASRFRVDSLGKRLLPLEGHYWYLFRGLTRTPSEELLVPLSYEEYLRLWSERSMGNYWDALFERSREESQRPRPKVTNRQEDGFLDQLFGRGGLKLRLQGTAELSAGLKSTRTDNPALPERARRVTYFDFDEKIQANVQATLGSKLHFGMNYNTAATFDTDAKKLKLSFEGEEDDIIKLIEVGNVSLTPRNSLISGGGQLFGLHSRLQIGALDVDLLVSQQQTQSRQVASRGGEQTESFELSVAQYDASRHYFLSSYFRDHYETALRSLPEVRSAVQVTRVEVWVTNRRGRFDDARDVVGFVDLGEPTHRYNPSIGGSGATLPANGSNALYATLNTLPGLRNSSGVTAALALYPGATLRPGRDYEKVERARRLAPNEYTLQPTLGYLSLGTPLAPDEVLAVAYEYTYGGQVYRVGEFTSDQPDRAEEVLFVKLLESTDRTPQSSTWPLMLRNVYRLGNAVRDVQREGFRLQVNYRDDATGIALPYLTEGTLKDKRLLEVTGLDRLDLQGEAHPDGRFDFYEGYTIRSAEGLIIFPTLEPFGRTLTEALGAGVWADRYAFPELYRETPTQALQLVNKNKYTLRGEYRASHDDEISLGAVGVAPGSVRVTAGGQALTEGTDYTVDYLAGKVKILNRQLIESKTPIEVSLQGGEGLGLQRKTLLGLDLNYRLSKELRLGATVMHLSELPLTTKTTFGQESMRNTMWGANLSYSAQLPSLTRLLNKLPFLDLDAPSSLSVSAEVAQLLPGHYESRYTSGASYLDDFEGSRSTIDLLSPYAWVLSSTPEGSLTAGLSPADHLRYGERRALLSWFTIDPLFTRERSRLTPAYIRNDPNLVSLHQVREIPTGELYPYRDQHASQPSYLQTLSLSFYPEELGPYNLNASSLSATGRIQNPRASWGGIMRKIDASDFESANVEYLEFWLMDPWADHPQGRMRGGGDLYFNLGDISEDILRDEKKAFESGLPVVAGSPPAVETVWGKVPAQQRVGYAFDNSTGAREKQDVGLNGLSTEEEKTYPAYMTFISQLQGVLSPATRASWQADPLSPLNDPGRDDFRHYRSSLYDSQRSPILERYKYYNGTEGNSSTATGEDGYALASTLSPDAEDVNGDYTLNEINRYFEYRVSLRPQDLVEGRNFIVGERRVPVTFRSGETSQVTWYLFRIPLSQPTDRIGGMTDLRRVRFMRLYLTDFAEETHLRFGALRLVRGDWRTYTGSLEEGSAPAPSSGELTVSAVSIEEHADRQPVSYVLPPGVSRSLDAQQGQSLQQNEQALSLRLKDLPAGEAKAVYRQGTYDLRRYRRLQLFAHAEELLQDPIGVQDGDFELFLRLGSDYTHNYYEYALPLRLTPAGTYRSDLPADRRVVWPDANYIDLALESLVELKRQRNVLLTRGGGGASLYQRYTQQETNDPTRRLTVLGSPSLSHIRTLMIGVRNASGMTRSVEVWVNELRLGDYHEEAGWAGNAQLALQLSSLGSVNLRGQYTSAGFGAIDAPLAARTLASRSQIYLNTQTDLGRLFPPKAKLSIPLYYSLSEDEERPDYLPTDEDVHFKDALRELPKTEQKALEKRSITHRRNEGLALTGVNLGIRSKEPMPYDPANVSFSYSRSLSEESSPTLDYRRRLNWQGNVSYDFSPTWRPVRPFAKLSGESPWVDFLRQYSLTLWPSRLRLETTMLRNYEEEQLRPQEEGRLNALPATFAQQFLWNRRLELAWTPIPTLSLTLSAGTDARIEEPHEQVNRRLNPDGWVAWQDSVMQSIRQGGTPQHYGQQVSLTYQLPTSQIKPLSFVSAQLAYTSAYTWDRGARLADPAQPLAHQLSSQGNLDLSSAIQLRQLYAKLPYLAKLEKRYASSPSPSISKAKGRSRGEEEEGFFHSLLDRLVYTLMSAKEVQLSYRSTRQTLLSGFLPSIGWAGGQGHLGSSLSPGIPFSLGLTDVGWIDKLADEGALLMDPERARAGVFTQTRTLDVRATLQPWRDLTITLTANHSRTDRTDVQYMQAGHPRLYGGDFTMTGVGLRGFFAPLRAESGYPSKVFEEFLLARSTIAQRWREQGLVGASTLSPQSSALLIPAFRAVYMRSGGARGVSLSSLPSLSSVLPNWSLTYTGLSRWEWLKKYFRSVSLRHAYRGIYTVGSFSSFAGWSGADPDGLGLIRRQASDGSGALSSEASYAYDFTSVAFQESFYPLIGIDMTWHSGIGMTAQWRESRGRMLNLAAYSLIESMTKEVNVGLSYKVADLTQLFRPRSKGGRRSRQRAGQAKKGGTSSPKGLTLRTDYSLRNTATLIRSIQTGTAEATAGQLEHRLRVTLDYDLSRLLGLKVYYDYSRQRPLVSTYAYPMATSSFGVSLRISLMN